MATVSVDREKIRAARRQCSTKCCHSYDPSCRAHSARYACLIAAHALSRFSAISFLYTHDYVRTEGTGKSSHITQRMNRTDLSLAAVFGLIPLLAFDLVAALFIIGVIAIARWLMARYFTKRLSGYSGDCLGMAQQLSEVLIYLCILGTWMFV